MSSILSFVLWLGSSFRGLNDREAAAADRFAEDALPDADAGAAAEAGVGAAEARLPLGESAACAGDDAEADADLDLAAGVFAVVVAAEEDDLEDAAGAVLGLVAGTGGDRGFVLAAPGLESGGLWSPSGVVVEGRGTVTGADGGAEACCAETEFFSAARWAALRKCSKTNHAPAAAIPTPTMPSRTMAKIVSTATGFDLGFAGAIEAGGGGSVFGKGTAG